MNEEQTDQFIGPAFGRKATTGPFGALDIDVGGKVNEATADAFRRVCRINGQTPSEVIRDFVFLAVHGQTYSEMCFEDAKAKAQWLRSLGPERALHSEIPAGAQQ